MDKQLAATMEYQAPAQYEPETIMTVISRAASDPTTDVDKLERLMAMYERLEARKAETAFNEAMNLAQKEIGRIAPDAYNDHTKSSYATYAALDRVLRPIYIQHGFSLGYNTGDSPENSLNVLCDVSHTGGHTKHYKVLMPADGKGAKGNDVMTKTHATGSAMQYGMRYLAKLIFNVAIGKDDDGNQAGATWVTEEQVANIKALFDEVKPNIPAFLKYFKVTKLEELPEAKYKDAVKMLEGKRKG